jgi:hypothetical protein
MAMPGGDTEPGVDQRDRAEISRHLGLDLAHHFDDALLVGPRGHEVHGLLQQDVARRQQEKKQHQHGACGHDRGHRGAERSLKKVVCTGAAAGWGFAAVLVAGVASCSTFSATFAMPSTDFLMPRSLFSTSAAWRAPSVSTAPPDRRSTTEDSPRLAASADGHQRRRERPRDMQTPEPAHGRHEYHRKQDAETIGSRKARAK